MGPMNDGSMLAFVDHVLDDLRWEDGMFVGRRSDANVRGVVVIQSGEDGRYRFALPDLGSADSVLMFVADLQAHLTQVCRRAVPACPLHDHALVCDTTKDRFEWVCPNAAWRCAVGDYEEQAWPPKGLSVGGLAAAVSRRLQRHGIGGVRRIGVSDEGGRLVARIGVWPMSDPLTADLRHTLAPVLVEVHPKPGPLPRRA
jgi:hypothetical protein